MMGSDLTPTMQAVIAYLDKCNRASAKAIRAATGAGQNTVVALTGRQLIVRSGTQYRLTDRGRERVREEEVREYRRIHGHFPGEVGS